MEIHSIFCQKGHAFPLGQNNLVEIRLLTARDVKVVGFWIILSIFVMKEGDTELE
jgi:hypothetical protein